MSLDLETMVDALHAAHLVIARRRRDGEPWRTLKEEVRAIDAMLAAEMKRMGLREVLSTSGVVAMLKADAKPKEHHKVTTAWLPPDRRAEGLVDEARASSMSPGTQHAPSHAGGVK